MQNPTALSLSRVQSSNHKNNLFFSLLLALYVQQIWVFVCDGNNRNAEPSSGEITAVDVDYFKVLFLHLIKRKMQVRIRVRNAISKVNKLVLNLELILKTQSMILKSIIKLCAVDIFDRTTWVKLYVLTILNPLFGRWAISIYLHTAIIE